MHRARQRYGVTLYDCLYCSHDKMVRFSKSLRLTYGICLFIIILFTIYKYYHQDKFELLKDSRQRPLPVLQEKIAEPNRRIEPI
jgi:hypothetical protein